MGLCLFFLPNFPDSRVIQNYPQKLKCCTVSETPQKKDSERFYSMTSMTPNNLK